MGIKHFIAVAAAALLALAASAEGVSPRIIIPQVKSYTLSEGSIVLEKGAAFSISATDAKEDLSGFKAYLETCDLSLIPAAKGGPKPVVRFKIGPKALKNAPKDAYSMVIGRKDISICAAEISGAFYAVQSLIKMTAASPGRRLACCRIDDAPRFSHRGLMFDVVRHFHGKDFILKQLDAMALLGMNKLHFHLTDNEAWRLDLECAPEMVRKAAFGDSKWFNTIFPGRPLTLADAPEGYVPGSVYDDGAIYGGYYSKDDIREIIAYAAARNIDVIPEIELPGHNLALLHVHPEFFCDGEHMVPDVFCAGKEAPFVFFEKVLEEVMDLFPSRYIHIGGDEASKDNWSVCSRCAERMHSEGLKDVFELQSYCIRRMEKLINAHGKRLIGWDEILEGGLSGNATVMSWRGTAGGVKAISMAHDVIMSPNTYYYLDYGQDAPYKEPLAFRTYLPLDVVYGYEPEADIEALYGGELSQETRARILGVQGNLWSECVVSDSHFEYMLYPRAFAIAETGWSPKGSKDYETFRENAIILSRIFNEKGITTFDLTGEAGERREARNEISRITRSAKAVMRTGNGKETDASVLVDGYLGGWALKGSDLWVKIPKSEITIDVDLGSAMDIHYIGAEFADHNARRCRAPQDTEFTTSVDGINYVPAQVPQLRIDESSTSFAIRTAGGTVSTRARYIRLRFNLGSEKVNTYISEVIVN
ncbi:MAG: beta-N-acetylhexosaminidase [Bacteroidales bacterium]|nr:beta-N-acetylhexosaminidase [Bacteroidales bacterium]